MNTPDLGFTPKGLYIGGEWQESTCGKTFDSINPSNRERLGEVPEATEKDVDRAVASAKASFKEWRRVPIAERARCLEILAQRIDNHTEELALMDAVDAGNALSGMRGDMEWTAKTFRYFAGLITEIKGESSSQGSRHLNITRRQPYGVVAKINPFNHPFRFCA
jgi:betaine-aldehyde dehydrogenase